MRYFHPMISKKLIILASLGLLCSVWMLHILIPSVAAQTNSVTFKAVPESIEPGDYVMLTWNAPNAYACEIGGDLPRETVASAGSRWDTYVYEDRTYTLTCTGRGWQETKTARVTVEGIRDVSLAISSNFKEVLSGGDVTLTWNATHARTCTASGDWSGGKAVTGSQKITNITNAKEFTLNCTGTNGSTIEKTVTVGITTKTSGPLNITLTATPKIAPQRGGTKLEWNTNAELCLAWGSWNGLKSSSGSQSIAVPTKSTYNLICIKGSEIKNSSVTVDVEALPASASLVANPAVINTGQSSTLYWNSTNATKCTGTGFSTGDKTTGSVTVSPTSDTTYRVNCDSTGGNANDSAIVRVARESETTANLSASPLSIRVGQSSMLSWSSTYADSCTGTGFSTGGNTSGTVTVSPTSNATYSVVCSGTGGSATDSVTVVVGDTPPGGTANEVVVFDWDGVVTKSDRGFPKQEPPINNTNWVSPTDFTDGTVYTRIEIRDMPTRKNMKLQLGIWQTDDASDAKPNWSAHEYLESTTPQVPITYARGVVKTAVTPRTSMWVNRATVKGTDIEYNRPRFRTAMVVKNADGEPVSDFNGWNWNGENPDDWYPMDVRYTVVLVKKGATFSGWDAYIGAEPETTANLSASPLSISEGESSTVTWNSTN